MQHRIGDSTPGVDGRNIHRFSITVASRHSSTREIRLRSDFAFLLLVFFFISIFLFLCLGLTSRLSHPADFSPAASPTRHHCSFRNFSYPISHTTPLNAHDMYERGRQLQVVCSTASKPLLLGICTQGTGQTIPMQFAILTYTTTTSSSSLNRSGRDSDSGSGSGSGSLKSRKLKEPESTPLLHVLCGHKVKRDAAVR